MMDAVLPREFDTLVADDDPGIRDLLVDFLRSRGRIVAAVGDGRAAVTALSRSTGSCRLVFADVAMPGADGFAVLTAARAANPSAYVVMITGFGSLESAITAVRMGAQDYLTKPFSLSQVDLVLRDADVRLTAHADASHRDAVLSALAGIESRLAAMEAQLRRLAGTQKDQDEPKRRT